MVTSRFPADQQMSSLGQMPFQTYLLQVSMAHVFHVSKDRTLQVPVAADPKTKSHNALSIYWSQSPRNKRTEVFTPSPQ